jgi:hypothetical protein
LKFVGGAVGVVWCSGVAWRWDDGGQFWDGDGQ